MGIQSEEFDSYTFPDTKIAVVLLRHAGQPEWSIHAVYFPHGQRDLPFDGGVFRTTSEAYAFVTNAINARC
jgi:hypothetical protein